MKQKYFVIVIILAALGALAIYGYVNQKPTAQDKKNTDEAMAQMDAEKKLMSDPGRALGELQSRLRSQIAAKDGIVVIKASLGMMMGPSPIWLGEFALPSHTPWVLQCGMGVTITFGSSVSGGSNDNNSDNEVTNDVKITLSDAMVPQSVCDAVAVPLGKTLQQILAVQ